MKTKNNLTILEEEEDVFAFGNTLPLRIFPFRQDNTIMHGHDFAEIAVITEGRGVHSTIREQVDLEPGDILLVPLDGIHAYTQVDNLELINILFSPLKLHLLFSELHNLSIFRDLFLESSAKHFSYTSIRHFRMKHNEFTNIKLLLNYMIAEGKSKEINANYCILGYFIVLLSKLSELCPFEQEKSMPKGIEQVIRFLHENFHKNVQLSELIQISKMSQSSFLRYFAIAIGNSPINYLNDLRLAQACALLRKTNLRISDIAFKVGFNDSNYFSRLFCQHFKMPPREYRKASSFSLLKN